MDDPSPSIGTYLERVTPQKRQRDAERLLELMTWMTGRTPRLWGSVIGFGQYHYKYASGRDGDAPAAGFAHAQVRHGHLSGRRHRATREAAPAVGAAYHGRWLPAHQGSRQDRHLSARKHCC